MAEEQVTRKIELVVIGGSSGSLEALLEIFLHLRPGFSTPMLIVQHRSADFESRLKELLSARSGLAVCEIEEKEPVKPRHVYLAPGDYHVLIEKDKTFSFDYSEKVHFSRPSIDVGFKSAADVYASHLCGILLSGANSDGADGIAYIKAKGGITIVQEPATAVFSFMPVQALSKTAVDIVCEPEQIADFLNKLL